MAIGLVAFGVYCIVIGLIASAALLVGVPMALAARRHDWAHRALCRFYEGIS